MSIMERIIEGFKFFRHILDNFFQVLGTNSNLYAKIKSIPLSSFFGDGITPTRSQRMTFA